MQNNNNYQNGSVIIWILIAVGLMAALSYAFMGSSRTSTNMLTDAQAEAYASEIIAYGNEVKQAVKRLQLRGCSDTEISFENNVVSGYTNPNSPADKSCHVFDVAGGGLTWKVRNEEWNSTCGGFPLYFCNEISFDAATRFPGMGTDDLLSGGSVELTMRVFGINQKMCEAINKLSGIPLPVPASTFNAGKFLGSYTSGTNLMMQTPSGYLFGCHTYGTSSPYNFYYILIAR